MTIDEAISHAKEVGIKMLCKCDTQECDKEHLQLAAWLEELKKYRKAYGEFSDSCKYMNAMDSFE